MILTQVKKRITTSTTTVVKAESCAVTQIVISVANAGTTWKFKMQDKALSPFVLIPEITVAAPTTSTTAIINFDDPIYMDGGVDIITSSGTPGEIAVWISMWVQG
jgi:hypothetical protein